MKSRRLKLAWHMALMWDTRNAYWILVGNLKGRGQLRDMGLDG